MLVLQIKKALSRGDWNNVEYSGSQKELVIKKRGEIDLRMQ
jgi:hypothetical protein